MITSLVIGGSDPYQTTYRDWRLESPPVSGFDPKEHGNDWRSRMRAKNKYFKLLKLLLGLVLICITLLMAGCVVYGEDGSVLEGLKQGNIRKCSNSATEQIRMTFNALKVAMPDSSWEKAKSNINWAWMKPAPIASSHRYDQVKTRDASSTTLLNSEQLIWATPTSISKVTKSKQAETTAQIPLRGVLDESTGQVQDVRTTIQSMSNEGKPDRNLNEVKDSDDQSRAPEAPPSHVEALYRKHAQIMQP